MVEAPEWFVWTFDLILVIAIIMGLLFLKAWIEARRVKGMMLIDMREPTGMTDRHLAKPESNGDTVVFEGGTYMLTKPPSADIKSEDPVDVEDEEAVKAAAQKRYPRIRFAKYPKNPLMGLPMFQHTLRLEEYQRGNPEPIHPFYGRVDKDGKFIDSQLTVTSTEWQAQKSTIQATAIAMSVQEREAWEKDSRRALANLPNKMIVYIGIGLAVLFSGLGVFILYQGG